MIRDIVIFILKDFKVRNGTLFLNSPYKPYNLTPVYLKNAKQNEYEDDDFRIHDFKGYE